MDGMRECSVVLKVKVFCSTSMTDEDLLYNLKQDLSGKGVLPDGVLLHSVSSDGEIIMKGGEIAGI